MTLTRGRHIPANKRALALRTLVMVVTLPVRIEPTPFPGWRRKRRTKPCLVCFISSACLVRSVLFHCFWLSVPVHSIACKDRLQNDLLCVKWDVKPTHSITRGFVENEKWLWLYCYRCFWRQSALRAVDVPSWHWSPCFLPLFTAPSPLCLESSCLPSPSSTSSSGELQVSSVDYVECLTFMAFIISASSPIA